MCGFVGRVIDSPYVKALMAILELDNVILPPGKFRPRGILKGVIIEEEGQLKSVDATWWFALTKSGDEWQANPKLTSFNARDLSKPLWKNSLNSNRALVFADEIGERHQGSNTQFLMQANNGLALGAIYKKYISNGIPHYAVAIITRPPVAAFAQFHEKSMPLFIPPDKALMQQWLKPDNLIPSEVQSLLEEPKLFYDLSVTPVKTYVRGEVIGPTELIAKQK